MNNKNIYYKLGAWGILILGIVQSVARLLEGTFATPSDLEQVEEIKNMTLALMGSYSMVLFNDGYSIAIGVLLFFYGLQLLMNKKPSRGVILTNIAASAVGALIARFYFPWGFLFFIFSLVCFIVQLANKAIQHNHDKTDPPL